MRRLLPLALVLGAALWLLLRERDATPAASPAVSRTPPATSPVMAPADSPAEIFRRVFWKRPGEGDRILQAERREEKLADGRSRWRSFLEVEASPALLDYLRRENAFGMVRLAGVAPVQDAPKWFVIESSTHEAFATPPGSLKVFFAKMGGRLYAYGEATSFTAPAPVPPKPAPAPEETSSGRLPAGPPPGTR